MTGIFDVLPALLLSGTALTSAAGAATAAGGVSAAFGTGLTVSGLGALGFTSGVVGAGGLSASAGLAGLGSGLLAAVGTKEAFFGATTAASLLSGASSLLKSPENTSKAELKALKLSEKPDVAGDAHLKRLKAMVAGRRSKTTSKEGGLLKTGSGGQKLGNS